MAKHHWLNKFSTFLKLKQEKVQKTLINVKCYQIWKKKPNCLFLRKKKRVTMFEICLNFFINYTVRDLFRRKWWRMFTLDTFTISPTATVAGRQGTPRFSTIVNCCTGSVVLALVCEWKMATFSRNGFCGAWARWWNDWKWIKQHLNSNCLIKLLT